MMSPTNNRKLSTSNRHTLVDRCSTIRACENCRKRKKLCNGQKPCTLCNNESLECIYNLVNNDHNMNNNNTSSRSVFVTNTARRLSSGSACETCRRRKTKCDGNNPCAFCASNNLVCINNSERRKRASITNGSSPLSLNTTTTTTSNTSNTSLITTNNNLSTTTNHLSTHSDETIDRIEDRLRRIEQLMTAFAPNQLSQSSSFYNNNDIFHSSASHFIRPQRHSVQGINVAKERLELQIARRALSSSPPQSTSLDKLHAGAYITPPNSGGKKNQPIYSSQQQYSPEMTKMTRQHSNPLTSSMYNLTLSPSSSTSSNNNHSDNNDNNNNNNNNNNTQLSYLPQSSLSTPLDFNHHQHYHQRSISFGSQNDSNSSISSTSSFCTPVHSTSPPMPSLMDQLSERTFATNLNYPTQNSYPIYPINHT